METIKPTDDGELLASIVSIPRAIFDFEDRPTLTLYIVRILNEMGYHRDVASATEETRLLHGRTMAIEEERPDTELEWQTKILCMVVEKIIKMYRITPPHGTIPVEWQALDHALNKVKEALN